MSEQAEWFKGDERLVIRELHPILYEGEYGRRWEGTDSRGWQVRLAYGQGGISIGAGDWPIGGGLYGASSLGGYARTATLGEVRTACTGYGWPITWPKEEE
jgi:hypothetical protein